MLWVFYGSQEWVVLAGEIFKLAEELMSPSYELETEREGPGGLSLYARGVPHMNGSSDLNHACMSLCEKDDNYPY
jgi:hypothetical protein